jgi:hypothetical protein
MSAGRIGCLAATPVPRVMASDVIAFIISLGGKGTWAISTEGFRKNHWRGPNSASLSGRINLR